jgi:hypothetical protein
MKKLLLSMLVLGLIGAGIARADDVPNKVIEIYRIAPGQHENFLKLIALYDQASKEAGVAPRQLYVHQDGAS